MAVEGRGSAVRSEGSAGLGLASLPEGGGGSSPQQGMRASLLAIFLFIYLFFLLTKFICSVVSVTGCSVLFLF